MSGSVFLGVLQRWATGCVHVCVHVCARVCMWVHACVCGCMCLFVHFKVSARHLDVNLDWAVPALLGWGALCVCISVLAPPIRL